MSSTVIEYRSKCGNHMCRIIVQPLALAVYEKYLNQIVERIKAHTEIIWKDTVRDSDNFVIKIQSRPTTKHAGFHAMKYMRGMGIAHKITINPFSKSPHRYNPDYWAMNKARIMHVVDHEFGHAYEESTICKWRTYGDESFADSYAVGFDKGNVSMVARTNQMSMWANMPISFEEPEFWQNGEYFNQIQVPQTPDAHTYIGAKEAWKAFKSGGKKVDIT